jgi:hypothetical protein
VLHRVIDAGVDAVDAGQGAGSPGTELVGDTCGSPRFEDTISYYRFDDEALARSVPGANRALSWVNADLMSVAYTSTPLGRCATAAFFGSSESGFATIANTSLPGSCDVY